MDTESICSARTTNTFGLTPTSRTLIVRKPYLTIYTLRSLWDQVRHCQATGHALACGWAPEMLVHAVLALPRVLQVQRRDPLVDQVLGIGLYSCPCHAKCHAFGVVYNLLVIHFSWPLPSCGPRASMCVCVRAHVLPPHTA